jgi:proline iminopeptidase
VTQPDTVPQPYDEGMLDVGVCNQIYWQVRGIAGDKPAVVVHGGPGAGFTRGGYRRFDREGYQLVLFDQRGCGSSTPHASDRAAVPGQPSNHRAVMHDHFGCSMCCGPAGNRGR